MGGTNVGTLPGMAEPTMRIINEYAPRELEEKAQALRDRENISPARLYVRVARIEPGTGRQTPMIERVPYPDFAWDTVRDSLTPGPRYVCELRGEGVMGVRGRFEWQAPAPVSAAPAPTLDPMGGQLAQTLNALTAQLGDVRAQLAELKAARAQPAGDDFATFIEKVKLFQQATGAQQQTKAPDPAEYVAQALNLAERFGAGKGGGTHWSTEFVRQAPALAEKLGAMFKWGMMQQQQSGQAPEQQQRPKRAENRAAKPAAAAASNAEPANVEPAKPRPAEPAQAPAQEAEHPAAGLLKLIGMYMRAKVRDATSYASVIVDGFIESGNEAMLSTMPPNALAELWSQAHGQLSPEDQAALEELAGEIAEIVKGMSRPDLKIVSDDAEGTNADT
jgi:hypothetical protein